MSKDTLEPWNDPEIEVRLVAMALGEASEFERAELERVIEKDAGLKRFYAEMCELHGCIHQAVLEDDDPEWKLSAERKEALHTAFGAPPEAVENAAAITPDSRSSARQQWRSFVGIAACFLFTLFSMAMVFYRKSVEPHSTHEITSYGSTLALETRSGSRQRIERELADDSGDLSFSGKPAPSSRMSKKQAVGHDVIDELMERDATFPATPPTSAAREIAGLSDAPAAPAALRAQNKAERQSGIKITGAIGSLNHSAIDMDIAEFKGEIQQNKSNMNSIATAGNRSGSYGVSRDSIDSFPNSPNRVTAFESAFARSDLKLDATSNLGNIAPSDQFDSFAENDGSAITTRSEDVRQNLYLAEGNFNLGKYDDAEEEYKNVLRKDRYNKAARRGMERISSVKSDYYRAAYDHTRSELLSQVDKAWGIEVPPVALNSAESAQIKIKLGKKKTLISDEISASEKPDSTFSLNVNDASYNLAKAALLERGEWPAEESVRTEEFVNAFDYDDPQPTMAQKVACAMDQSVHPFIQQRNLLRISMSTAAQGRSNPLNVVILLDSSGSMERADREASVLKIMQVLSAQLGPDDKVTLMSFARQTRLLADSWGGDKVAEFAGIIRSRPSEGGTNLEQAIQVAQKHLLDRKRAGTQSRIMLLTDGAANLGDANPESLTKMVEQMRDREIAFDACGIGAEGLDDGILEALTRKGDGRYYVVNKAEDADEGFAQQIAGALRPAAKNVKVQVIFNPDRVGNYRLLGFEKHRLNKEDFRNDSVDAAEMAAEESGSALYQVEAKPDGEGEVGTVFVRFLDTATGQMVERNWTIPYLPQAPTLENAAPQLQLAAVAGMLGEKLHRSDNGTVDFTRINAILGKLQTAYPNNQQVQELLQMVDKVKN